MGLSTTELAARFPAITSHLHEPALAAFAGALTARDLSAGESLIEEGKPSDTLYLVDDGALRVSILVEGNERALGELQPGAIVGEVAVMDPGAASATVRAIGPTRILQLTRPELDRLAAQQPDAVAALLGALCRTVAERITAVNERCDEILRKIDPQASLGGEPAPHHFRDYFRLHFGRHREGKE
jgi:CRP-like cAMP-binding protein